MSRSAPLFPASNTNVHILTRHGNLAQQYDNCVLMHRDDLGCISKLIASLLDSIPSRRSLVGKRTGDVGDQVVGGPRPVFSVPPPLSIFSCSPVLLQLAVLFVGCVLDFLSRTCTGSRGHILFYSPNRSHSLKIPGASHTFIIIHSLFEYPYIIRLPLPY